MTVCMKIQVPARLRHIEREQLCTDCFSLDQPLAPHARQHTPAPTTESQYIPLERLDRAQKSTSGLVRVRREATMPEMIGPLSGFPRSSQISQHVPIRLQFQGAVSQDCSITGPKRSATENLDSTVVG